MRGDVYSTHRPLKAGTRVRLRAPSSLLRLTSDMGTVVGPAEWDGYYIVHLDEPARYLDGESGTEELSEIREDEENLTVIAQR